MACSKSQLTVGVLVCRLGQTLA